MIAGYRATMFDGEAGVDWLRPGWRALRQYGRKARAAIEAGDIVLKAQMIYRADRLLLLMTGILDTGPGTTLGPALMKIYTALQANLLRANINDDVSALDEFDRAIEMLTRDLVHDSRTVTAA